MPLVTVKAIPYMVMQSLFQGADIGMKLLSKKYDKTFLISVTNPVYEGMLPEQIIPKLIEKDTPEAIGLQFDDEEPLKDSRESLHPSIVLFNEEHALKICEMIYRIHYKIPGNHLLIVNCMAGISRSGAISEFTRIVCDIPFSHWKKHNLHVIPNLHVKKTLLNVWEKNFLDKITLDE